MGAAPDCDFRHEPHYNTFQTTVKPNTHVQGFAHPLFIFCTSLVVLSVIYNTVCHIIPQGGDSRGEERFVYNTGRPRPP